MKIKKVKINKLKPYKNNPKQHPKSQIETIKKSIKEFGFRVPVLIDAKNNVVAGHGRILAAKELDIKELPTIKITDLTSAQIKAFRIMDNKSTESPWEYDFLKTEFEDLKKLNFNLEFTGFTDSEIESILPNDIQEDDFKPPSKDEEIKTDIKRGDIYQLGEHRLMCGDSTEKDDVKNLMQGNKADMVFTDPPFNVNYEYEEYQDNKSDEEYLSFVKDLYTRIDENTKDGAVIYIMSGNKYLLELGVLFKSMFRFSQILFWVKDNPTLGNSDYQYNYEAILYGWNKRGTHKYYGGSVVPAANLVSRDTGREKTIHKAQRPIKLVSDYVKNSSKKDDIVLDLFGGSGSTLIACEQTDRTCYMMEIDPVYCQVIIDRYEKFTNNKSEKIST